MTKHMNVGRSWRTHAKHELMSSFIGQEVGVVNHALRDMKRLVWIDLTAGDAARVDNVKKWHEGCSPGILAWHAAHSQKPVGIFLHEIQDATYDRLLGNLERHLPEFGYAREDENTWRIGNRVVIRAHNVTGQQADVSFIQKSDAVFVLNDPNAITEWAMRDNFAQEITTRTWCFRSLSTMGCNPAGLKRLEKEERLHWFSFPDTQERALPRYRDLVLAAIDRDEAQWAYLLSTSEKWRGKTEAVFKTAFRKCGRTAAMAWLRENPDQFAETKRTLFLTKKELRESNNPTLPLEEAS
ncbi:hypothetical protein ACWGMA_08400 [Streptomyces asiaticus]